MAYREIKEVLPDQERAADVPTDLPRLPPPQEEAADTPEDRSEPAPLPVEQADTLVAPNKMETPQIHEEEELQGSHSYWWTPILETPPVVVESLVVADPPVQLERSQRTKAPPPYLQDFWCDLVDVYSILQSVNRHKRSLGRGQQFRVAVPQYRETQL